ncbi:major facilitator superfamily transporter protein, partial [gut metagenome]
YFFQPTAKSGLPSLLPDNRLLGFITVMALITGLGKIVDAVTDPLVASLSDRCTHIEGRRLPFLRRAAIPYALSVLLISMPLSGPDLRPMPSGWGSFVVAYY